MAATRAQDALSWSQIEKVLPSDWREIAAEQRLIRNRSPHLGGKVRDVGEIVRMVLYMVATNSALAVTTATFAAAQMLTISSVSLHQWMQKLGPYFASLVARMVAEEHSAFMPERWAGYEVIAVDATVVTNPGAKGTTSRVHKAIRLTDLRVVEVHVTDETGGETFRRFKPRRGQLWLGDRVYPNPPGIAWVVAEGGAVLVRYNRGSLPLYDAAGSPIDVLNDKLVKLTKPCRSREWQAFVHAGDKRIAGRLCAVRLPKDKAEEARTRARKEQGAVVTDDTLRMAEFVVVFTTVPRDKLTCDLILELYRLRWQIELEFKRDKSITGLDRLPNFRPDTIEAWLYAKLLLHQITRKLAASVGDVPPCAIADAAARSETQAA
jgi:Transposase DDE domain